MKTSLPLPAACAALLLLAACTPAPTPIPEPEAPSSVPAAMEAIDDTDDDTIPPGYDQSSSAPEAVVPAEDGTQARIIEMTVTDWTFAPSSIVAVKGEKLVIRITGAEGAHSFAVPELGLNVKVNPGETKDIEIPTDKASTFSFRCAVPCGPGHKDMKGEIVIN